MYVTKADGRKEKFSFEKIVRTGLRAGVPRQEAERIAREVEAESYDGIRTREVLDMILRYFGERKTVYASKYDLKGAIMRLGPSGFPFEKLIAEMFEKLGYSTVTDVTISGRCVSHEVDVIIEKESRRYMVECKYRNFPGAYIGIHKALYVWARFLDLQAGNSLGRCGKLDAPYLVCNTKFSDDTIQYASCMGLKLKGWNYPQDNSIAYILTKNKIYPVTVLRTVNARTLQLLSGAKMMFCDDLSEEKLTEIGIPRRRSKDIMGEVAGILADNN